MIVSGDGYVQPVITPPAEYDSEMEKVFARLMDLDPKGERTAKAIRRTFDMLLDGQHTGRFRWEQLHKTEKTHCGTLVEINLQREFGFADGTALDYSIEDAEVDCKYSQDLGEWMIPPEAVGQILLGVWANDQLGRCSAGLVRARPEVLTNGKGNRDLKRRLTKEGKQTVRWLFQNASLPENTLLRMPAEDVAAIFDCGKPGHKCRHGTKRVNELFRRAQGRLVGRTAVATVAQQEDYMKRIRGNGGARSDLRPEGIVIFGQYDSHRGLAQQLGLPLAGPGESISVRLAERRPRHIGLPFIQLGDKDWVVALPDDPIELAPVLPETKKSSAVAE
ncbi:NaeI family type II restriction endonuclease [Nonomuraea sp. NPDC049152]|uniref:NaeI family type II restriction endonuclease n=1 Tax=Nonomuraea sp. NPDC049152 TaxID=3154350 RepID=UPI0033ED93E6